MAQEQLIRSYPNPQMPRIFESDWRELGRKGWSIAQRREGGGVTTVTYRRESVNAQAVAPIPSPLPTALEPLPPEVRRYSQLETLILVIGYVLALTIFLAGGSALFNWIAALLFLGTSAYALAIDW